MHQIMISAVSSVLSDAEALMKYLVIKGYTVFLCSELEGGTSYRAQICETAAKCEIYIPFMNLGWCTSAERQFEFNVALSENLKSHNQTPFIVPIVLEDLSYYDNFPVLKGFLVNTTAITARKRDLGELTWGKVLKSIQSRNLPPASPKPISRIGLTTSFESSSLFPFSSSYSSPSPSPASSTTESFAPLPRRISPTPPFMKGESKRISPRPRGSIDSSSNLQMLLDTASQLISGICQVKVYGIGQFHIYLQEVLRILNGMTIRNESESALRALVDYLGKTTDLLPSWKSDETRCPVTHFIEEDITKLTHVVKSPFNPVYHAGEFIKNFETRLFWDTHFEKTKFAVPWQQFVEALKKDTGYKVFTSIAEATGTLNDLRAMLDHYNTGFVVCHRLSDFAKNQTLLFALQQFHDNKFIVENSGQVTIKFPLLLWIDHNPENNTSMVDYARDYGVNVFIFNSASDAKQWINSNSYVLKRDSKSFRVITGNMRTGAGTILDLNAGEDIARFIRGRRSKVPILVYCGDLNYTKYTSKYEHCEATTSAAKCQSFIEEMFWFQ